MNILVGTKNQKKIDIVKNLFDEIWVSSDVVVTKHDAQSLVPEAPHGKDIYLGALNRASECLMIGNYNYYVGIESGLVERYGNTFEETWAIVIDSNEKAYVGYSSGLLLPNLVTERMNGGEKHDEIMSDLDVKLQLDPNNRDTWSRYSNGKISRSVSIEEALRNALIQLDVHKNTLYNRSFTAL